MEEKLLVWDALTLKGFFSKKRSHIINGPSSKQQTKISNETIPVNVNKVEKETEHSIKCVVDRESLIKYENDKGSEEKPKSMNIEEGKGREGQQGNILNEPVGKMEGDNNYEEDISNECNAHDNKELLCDLIEKTDDSDKCKESLIILSETNNSGDNEFETGKGDEDINGNIPNSKKISFTVQDWVNHLPSEEKSPKANKDSKNGKDLPNGITEDFSAIAARLSREASVQSNSSLDSLLDSRRPDPVEIFLNLGFGGVPGVNMENCRIPKRFLVPSKCKGGDWNEFLKRELIQAQNFECSSLGFRGLSGPSYRRPSAIVANIMEKLRERTVAPPHPRSRFSAVAKRVLNEKSVLNKLTSEFQSVLSPDNRKFLQNQGKISPEVPRRRIIFGQKSFAFAHDGEFVEVESGREVKPTNDNSPVAKICNRDGEDSPVLTDPEVLLKIRRSSLQKQKKVDDTDVEDVFFIVGNKEISPEPDTNTSPNECSKKAGKIPKRFLSSSNLKALENDCSDAMRLEVEKEIRTLSQQIKSISNQDLPSVLKQVKKLRSKIENTSLESS